MQIAKHMVVSIDYTLNNDAGDVIDTSQGESTVTVDGIHQLAGVTLHFDVTIRDVRDATSEEITQGHV